VARDCLWHATDCMCVDDLRHHHAIATRIRKRVRRLSLRFTAGTRFPPCDPVGPGPNFLNPLSIQMEALRPLAGVAIVTCRTTVPTTVAHLIPARDTVPVQHRTIVFKIMVWGTLARRSIYPCRVACSATQHPATAVAMRLAATRRPADPTRFSHAR